MRIRLSVAVCCLVAGSVATAAPSGGDTFVGRIASGAFVLESPGFTFAQIEAFAPIHEDQPGPSNACVQLASRLNAEDVTFEDGCGVVDVEIDDLLDTASARGTIATTAVACTADDCIERASSVTVDLAWAVENPVERECVGGGAGVGAVVIAGKAAQVSGAMTSAELGPFGGAPGAGCTVLLARALP